jgi:hypothetical protein
VSLPLVKILEIASACIPRDNTEGTSTQFERRAVDGSEEEAADDDQDDDLLGALAQMEPAFHTFSKEEPHKKHPHVITRRVWFICRLGLRRLDPEPRAQNPAPPCD